LVFFDDILIDSKTWEDHLQHVDKALQLLRDHQLFVKRYKFSFGAFEVEYLGHIVGHDGCMSGPQKDHGNARMAKTIDLEEPSWIFMSHRLL